MNLYILDMNKERWEIRIYDNRLYVTKGMVEKIKESDVYRYNEYYALSYNKEILKSYACSILDRKKDMLRNELRYYEEMKIKVTRK